MPGQYPISGHYQPASETPFGWHFACMPIVACFKCLLGIRSLIKNSSGTKTAQESFDEQPGNAHASLVIRAFAARILIAGMNMQFLSLSLESYTCMH